MIRKIPHDAGGDPYMGGTLRVWEEVKHILGSYSSRKEDLGGGVAPGGIGVGGGRGEGGGRGKLRASKRPVRQETKNYSLPPTKMNSTNEQCTQKTNKDNCPHI